MAAGIVPPPSNIHGRGNAIALDPAQNNTFRLINGALAAGGTVRFAPPTATTAARYLVAGISVRQADSLARAFHVSGERLNVPRAMVTRTVPTRIALYKGAPGNMDQGWTEWLFDTYGFKYTIIGPAALRDTTLGSRFDVVVMASQGLTSAGRGGRGGPPPGAAPAGRGGGPPATSADDSARIAGIDAFVRGGGTVVAWNQGTGSLISALQLPVRNVVAGVPRQEYFTGVSIMRAIVDTTHPVMAGMPAEADVVVSGSPVFTTLQGFDGSVLAKYPATGSPLRSGFLKGEERMRGHAAAVDVKRGKGHIILIAFQPQWRGQPFGTFRVVFNSAFFGRDVSARATGAPGFWVAPTNP
jgi:hypothetical protein